MKKKKPSFCFIWWDLVLSNKEIPRMDLRLLEVIDWRLKKVSAKKSLQKVEGGS